MHSTMKMSNVMQPCLDKMCIGDQVRCRLTFWSKVQTPELPIFTEHVTQFQRFLQQNSISTTGVAKKCPVEHALLGPDRSAKGVGASLLVLSTTYGTQLSIIQYDNRDLFQQRSFF